MERELQPIIIAQKIRIYPYSQYDRTVCLRAELIGCPFDGEYLLFDMRLMQCARDKKIVFTLCLLQQQRAHTYSSCWSIMLFLVCRVYIFLIPLHDYLQKPHTNMR